MISIHSAKTQHNSPSLTIRSEPLSFRTTKTDSPGERVFVDMLYTVLPGSKFSSSSQSTRATLSLETKPIFPMCITGISIEKLT